MTVITFDPSSHKFEYGSAEDERLLAEVWHKDEEIEKKVHEVGRLTVGEAYKPNAEFSDMAQPRFPAPDVVAPPSS